MELKDFSDSDLQAELKRRQGEDLYNLIDTFHAYMCTADHNHKCDYYNENMLVNKNELPTHVYWREALRTYLSDNDWTVASLREAFRSCSVVLEKFVRLHEKHQKLFQEIVKLNY